MVEKQQEDNEYQIIHKIENLSEQRSH